jgi:hypothetical protein
MTYPYNTKYERTVKKFKAGEITKDQAYDEIMETEKSAYETIPDAEPDGDITYGASFAINQIEKIIKKEDQDGS